MRSSRGARFEELTADLVEQCKATLERAIEAANLAKGGIENVILVGGSTGLPAVHDMVARSIAITPQRALDPLLSGALGAAELTGVFKGDVKDVLLLDVTPLSLGLETRGGVMTKLIERNTTIPTRRTEVFTTAEDMQPSVELHVLQGERETLHPFKGWSSHRSRGGSP